MNQISEAEQGDVIQYYYDFDLVIASIDRGRVMFRIKFGQTSWDFIHPGSDRWNSYHQDIFYSHHDFDPCPDDIVKKLPILPPIPDYKPIKWSDNFNNETAPLVSDFPLCTEYLREQPENSICVWFVLQEDTYETLFGDGKFLYLSHDIFLSEEEAQAYIFKHNPNRDLEKETGNYYMTYSFRSCTISLKDKSIISLDCEPDLNEHFRLQEILENLEAILLR